MTTSEPSRELSAGDIVAAGDVLLAVAPAGRDPVSGPLTGVRTREHGTIPFPLPGHPGQRGGTRTREGEPR